MQKLELTWIGKDSREKIEPRILLNDPSKNYGDPDSENILIHGDNLLALKALEPMFHGSVKCIYIDPPYNTQSAFDHYDDNREHSIWLSLMKARLELLYNLLADDGYIFVQIDDNEQAYLTILMDEIFGRKNHVNTICVNMNSLSGVKMTHVISGKRYPAQKEYILLYKKGNSFSPLSIEKLHKYSWDKEYNLIIPELGPTDFESFDSMEDSEVNQILSNMHLRSLSEYAKETGITLTEDWKWENAYRIFGSKSNRPLAKRMADEQFNQTLLCYTNKDGNKRYFRTDYNKKAKDPRIELVQAEANSSVFLSDNWTDISNDGGVAKEGYVTFPKGKKPERLIERIIKCASKEGDLILDSFLGSGTTAAVAHKMNRRWIGIEIGEQAYSHCIPRLNRIIDNQDPTGVSSSNNWMGGGGYKFYELAPSLITRDQFGNEVIDPRYNNEMLAAAIALLNGYTYAPDKDIYWKQGYSTEHSYIFTTTKFITREILDSIETLIGENENLLICSPAFELGLNSSYSNITLKKIPQSVLDKCTYGDVNYSLPIIEKSDFEEEDQ